MGRLIQDTDPEAEFELEYDENDPKPNLTLRFDLSDGNHYSVYRLTGPTGLVYYGMTGNDVKRRWKNGRAYVKNRHLKSDIEKFSFSEFKKEIIASNLSRGEAEKLEAELIARDGTTDPSVGYNVQKGNESDEDAEYDVYVFIFKDGKRYVGTGKRPIRNRWNRGYADNPELNSAIHAEGGLRFVKKEHFEYPLEHGSAERIESTLITYFESYKPEKGYNRTLGAGLNEKRPPDEKSHDGRFRAVRCVETGQVYPSIKAAAADKGLPAPSIGRTCNGRRKTAGGEHWEFV